MAGAGLMGHRHIELVLASDACELSAIVDPAPDALQLARTYGVRRFEQLEDLLATERPDGVILATPNQYHLDHCLACIGAHVAVLLEKPLAHTYEAGRRLCRRVEKAGAPVLVGHHRVHSPILERARDIIARGELGEIVAVTASALFYKPESYFEEAPWRRAPGGGPILINLIHDIGNLRVLCGEITAVHAFASNTIRHHAVEDTVAVNLRFINGALGTFLLSDTAASARSWEQTSRENRTYASYDDENCYHIAGTQGSLSIPTMRLRFYPKGAARSWWEPFETKVVDGLRDDPLERQLAHFCEVVRGERAPLVTVRDGLQNLRVTNAISESARTGRVVATLEESSA